MSSRESSWRHNRRPYRVGRRKIGVGMRGRWKGSIARKAKPCDTIYIRKTRLG